ncbi:MAG: YafY family transcriptional regulator [Acidobacteriia bacterium]|nr:YafY family transcriptional regulator [Methyloceanibacter sp.]MBX5472625.1 YafY family transcriptional regulator [Acetobacteraceae bacterium]MCL6490425.1 YafY family transcriptional regulator [Terriglobia bacterium]
MPLRRADRLFDIIQLLRTASRPVTAAVLATKLEVTPRTIYRDVATLQARRVPIEGAPGLGYMLRRGFELPPLMFTSEEIEAILVGVRLLRRTGDVGLQAAAARVLSKVEVVLPDMLRDHFASPIAFVSAHGAPAAGGLSVIRAAIRAERKLRIDYSDEQGRRTSRTIWPFALAYYVGATLVSAWCELRDDFRHFRADRVQSLAVLDEGFPVPGRVLTADWLRRFSSDVTPDGVLTTR